jgi:DNA-binding transcriptional ArsR family regulator
MTGMPDRQHVPIEVIAALHHPSRRRILDYLGFDRSATVGDIAAALGLQVGSVSHHLKTLEQAGLVSPDHEASSDRRQSWWRGVPGSLSWSMADFTGPERMMAAAAEVENLQHHLRRVMDWFAMRDEVDPAWESAAFSTDGNAVASPDQLADLGRRLNTVIREWTAQCREERSPDQAPVFVFAHGVPSQP